MWGDKSVLFVCACVCGRVSCPLWSYAALTLTSVSPEDWPTLSSQHDAQVPSCNTSWLAVASSPLIVPAPSPLAPSLSPSFRSHCFLRPLSLFLYHHLIRPATRALSGPVSHPAVFRAGRESEGGKPGANGDNKPMTAFSPTHVCCSAFVRVSARSALLCMHVRKLLRRRQSGVGKFTGKHRNPLLRDFHTVPRLRVRSQPPTVFVHMCVCLCMSALARQQSPNISWG